MMHTDALLEGTKWGYDTPGDTLGDATTITYSFPDRVSAWDPLYYGGEPNAGYALSDSQRSAFKDALQSWADVADIDFAETADSQTSVGDIRAAMTEFESAPAHAYAPGPHPEAGDIWLNVSAPSNENTAPGDFGFFTLVHEIGHAIGLKHPFENGTILPPEEDSRQFTIMSHDPHPTATTEASGPMLYDIAAAQYLYGPNRSFHAGDDVYRLSASREQVHTIWDAGGTDGIDASNQRLAVSVDLEAGHFSSIGVRSDGQPAIDNLAIAYGVTIENAFGGTGDDRIIGNDAANRLSGNAGDDVLIGGGGTDSFIFDSLDFGNDVIEDFQPGVTSDETLDFRGLGLSASDVTLTDANGTGDSQITVDESSDSIVLLGVQSSEIKGDDILLA
ncbi:M10 family metallopeptidase C-terminal domain-containing protein [Rhodospirillaceae bacterium SYSU D60014]|uniref:M10 family metallopeptidase n=1 Tax=Virgifigura deserti TaxID=2268457 RepID=UPI0013C49784